MRTLIVGFSTRAIAESAVRGGHPIVTLDYFGDRDQRALVENYALQREFDLPFSAEALLEASRRLETELGVETGAVVYVSNLENHPGIVEQLVQDRELLGNGPQVLRQVRDWRVLRGVCRHERIACPSTLLPGEEERADPSLRWLRKPVRSGGGFGIRFWDGKPLNLDGDHLLQAYVEGRPASAAFVADGKRSVIIGLTEQLIGQEALGADGFAWCGNILPLDMTTAERSALLPQIETLVNALTRRFELRGANGVDLVVTREEGGPRPYLVEVNPRYTASMELMERAYGLDIFSLHREAMAGRLPAFSLDEQLDAQEAFVGKGIVYARRDVTMPETASWTEQGRRDVPFPDERIQAGHPVCTVLAEGASRAACWEHLVARAEDVRREIGDR